MAYELHIATCDDQSENVGDHHLGWYEIPVNHGRKR